MSIVHYKNKKNGVTYVYESVGYWDKDKQQARNKRECIGKLDPITGEIIHNKRYLERMGAEQTKPGPVPIINHKRLFYGAIHLFDSIAEHLGVSDDLKICFPEHHRQIMSIAYYLILENRSPLSRFPKWAQTHAHPYGKIITSQRSSEVFQSIDEDSKQRFFKLQSERRLEDEYLAYDTTSISSYSRTLKQVRYGMNKDHDPLAQINLALLFGHSSRLPVCYRKMAGNISDVTTVKKLIFDLKYLSIDKVKLVMDRGFYSEANINDLYKHHYKFLIAAKTSLRLVKTKLDEVRGAMITRSNYSSRHDLYCVSFTTNWDYSELKPRSGEWIKDKKRLYLHIYYNDHG